jgi:F0F1-type ATP synthase gamma subunit
VSGDGDDGHPLLAAHRGRERLVVHHRRQGLAARSTPNIIRRAVELVRESSSGDVTLVVVGRKARDFFRRRSTPSSAT